MEKIRPIYCPHNTFVNRKLDRDECIACPTHLSRKSSTSSYRDDGCYFSDQCDCGDTTQCFYGASCACNYRDEPCGSDYEMNPITGECVRCQVGFVKPEVGCHRCVRSSLIIPRYFNVDDDLYIKRINRVEKVWRRFSSRESRRLLRILNKI